MYNNGPILGGPDIPQDVQHWSHSGNHQEEGDGKPALSEHPKRNHST
ncbi:hypothetical protein A2U01_0115263, partial [Trifolium medium]|nr:hypothetical protein [Trifolium medium]